MPLPACTKMRALKPLPGALGSTSEGKLSWTSNDRYINSLRLWRASLESLTKDTQPASSCQLSLKFFEAVHLFEVEAAPDRIGLALYPEGTRVPLEQGVRFGTVAVMARSCASDSGRTSAYSAIPEMTLVPGENRLEFRFPFTASAEFVELGSGVKIEARTGDISRKGLYLDTLTPFAVGTNVAITIASGGVSLIVLGTVAFCQPNLGMGVRVDHITTQDQEILEHWLTRLRSS